MSEAFPDPRSATAPRSSAAAAPRVAGAEQAERDRSTPPGRSIAEGLAEPLVQACEGRLSEIAWFRTDWQRGGAATAKARWRLDDGQSLPVVVKVPVNTMELNWMRRLQVDSAADGAEAALPVVPRLLRWGEELGAFDLAWIVIEQLPHGPLGGRWHDDHVPRIAAAIARFHAQASRHPVDREPRSERWEALLASARESIKVSGAERSQRWTAALRELGSRLGPLVEAWEARQPLEWLHGDLHLANAMSRVALDHGPVCLIDLADVHVGHWVEDAVYLERQLWARPERLRTHKPVRCIAECRRLAGCSNGEDHARLASIRRLLLAGTAPAFLKSEGAPAFLSACLDRLEEGLRTVK